MKKLIACLFVALSWGGFANATGVTPDQPINTFVNRNMAIPKTINSTSFSAINELTVEITPACSSFGASSAKAQLCAEFTNTSGNNLGQSRLLINGIKKTSSVFMSADSFSDKGTQCYTWVINGTLLNCGVANVITTEVNGTFTFQKAILTIDYKN